MLTNTDLAPSTRGQCFHASLALALLTQARHIQNAHHFVAIGLTGGVFQNRLLTEQVIALLEAEGFKVLLPEKIPGNDAGISFGQIIEGSRY